MIGAYGGVIGLLLCPQGPITTPRAGNRREWMPGSQTQHKTTPTQHLALIERQRRRDFPTPIVQTP